MASSTLIVLSAGIPWVAAVAVATLDGRRLWVSGVAAVGIGGSLAALIALTLRVVRSGPVEVVPGGWPAGVGIAVRADALGMAFASVSVGVLLVCFLYEVGLGVRSRTFPALVLLLAAGLSGLFLTGDVFSFYVFFEISMTAAFILTSYRERASEVGAAFIFTVVNLLGSVIFLLSIGALYHVTGTLEMTGIAARVGDVNPNSLTAITAGIFIAFALKLGLFPFHLWLPAVYVGSHPPVAAILSGALANIGSYGLLRFSGILPAQLELGSTALLVLGSVSIVYGAVQAVSRRDTREVLAYSAIGQVGYVLVALGVGGAVGLAAAAIYTLVNAVNKTLLFLAAPLRGPFVAATFAIGAFSVAGVPPTGGFVAKFAAFEAALAAPGAGREAVLAGLIFVGSALSFVYAFQIYQRAYVSPARRPRDDPAEARRPSLRVVIGAAAVVVLIIGVWPEPLFALGDHAAGALVGGLGGGAP